jgi:hypothetical protein
VNAKRRRNAAPAGNIEIAPALSFSSYNSTTTPSKTRSLAEGEPAVLFSTLLLFAQKKGPPPEAAAATAGVVIALYCLCIGTLLIFSIGFAIFNLMTLYKALSAVSQHNRDMEPGMIFLLFIPGFSVVWIFFVVLRIASSFQKEFEDRGIRSDGGDYGQTLGIWGVISRLVCFPVGIIVYIVWLFKIRGYTAQLTSKGRGSRDDDE